MKFLQSLSSENPASMDNPKLDIETIRTELVAKYRKLPALEQKIVQLFSVIYEPITRTSFADCFNGLGLKDKNKKAFTTPTLKPHIDQLVSLSLLLQERTQAPQCHPLLTEIATRDAVKAGTFEALVKAINKTIPIPLMWENGPRRFSSERQFLREVRIGLYGQDIEYIEEQFKDFYRFRFPGDHITLGEVLQNICLNPFDAEWLQTLPLELFETALISILQPSSYDLFSAEGAFALLQAHCATDQCTDFMLLLSVEQSLLRGKLQSVEGESGSDESAASGARPRLSGAG